MIWKWVMSNPPVNFLVGISSSLCSKLPNCPVLSMFMIEELDQLVERIAVCSLGVGTAWT